MNLSDYHIIHFDGHGVFARCCSECATMHSPQFTTCLSCTAPLDDIAPQGHLAFEDEFGDVDYVSTEAMENLLLGSEVRLIFLSACQSAVVQTESLFGGLGPGLIRAGIPSVVAMQFSVSVEATVSFARGFYTALTRGEPVPRAVAQGRRRLFRDKTWFIPTLYLRGTDDEGQLFAG
jgi:CHAT domain-containing protein